MATITSTRRSMLSAMAAVPALGLLGAPAWASSNPVEHAFTDWKAARVAIEAEDGDLPRGHILWKRISAAEHVIETHEDKSARTAEIRLWVGLAFLVSSHAQHNALLTEDIDTLISVTDQSESEYHEIMMMRAIKALR